jgi:tetratricopeptide (TPR) repeat protein
VTIHSIGFDHHAAHVAISKYHLAEALGHRFFHRFTHSDLDEQIISCREALPWIKEFAEGQLLAALMFCLGVALRVRFRISPQLEDVEEGINCLSRAVELSPADPEYLAELGKLHLYRYGTCGNADDMLQAEKLADRAFQLRIGHPARGLICHFRADCMTLVNQNRGTIAEAGDELTNLYKESLCWRSLGHHSHFEGWDGLGIALCAKYWQTGDAKYMNSCIIYSRTACALVHPKHFQASRFLHNYATALQQRFNVSGNLEDLHQSIHWGKQAVAAAPVQRQSDLLAIIGNCMSLLALSTGDTDLMSEAINVRREALRSSSEPTRHWRLYDVGAELIGRGSWLGNEESITEGIHYVRQALEGFAVGGSRHEDCVRALSGGILQLHRIRGASEHLDEVISLLEQVNAHLSEEFRRPSFLLLLGRAYRARFSRTAESNDMQLALQVDERALGILQPSNDRLKYDALVSIAEDRGIICSNQLHVSSSDIESTVQQLRQASSDLRPGHPDHQAVCVALAKLQLLPNTSSSDYNGAMALLLHTLRGLTGNPYQAVTSIIAVLAEVEKRWVPLWSPTDPARGRLLDVYRAVIDLLPRLASLDSDPSHRVQVLGQTRDMAGRAASQAIALEDFTSAVELLEAGRAVFWTQLLRTRTSFDGLDPDVAAELRDTARRLENMTGTSVPLDLDDHAARDRMERMFNERRRLSKQFDELVQTVQTQPGMGGFLRNADYDQLSHAARRGPVVVLHSSWMTVIASPGAAPRVLALTKLNDQWMSEAMRVMRSAAKRGRMRIDSRGMRKRPAEESISPDADIQAVFAELWRQVAQPLLEFLKWPVSLVMTTY